MTQAIEGYGRIRAVADRRVTGGRFAEGKMNILVVGGTKFYGIPMCEELLQDGHDVTIATRGNGKYFLSARHIKLDRSNYDDVKKALNGKEYDVIIDKIAYCSNDVKNLLENVRCKKYIQASSCSVYSEDKESIHEDSFNPADYHLVWMNRNDDYAEGKRQAERAALEYLDISQCIFVRYPVVMGPNDYTGRLKFYTNHIRQKKAMYVDDLDCKMSFIHEVEAGRFIACLIDKDISGAINGSSIGMISPREIINYIELCSGEEAIISQAGDVAPYNGAHADISYDLSKAGTTGFHFSQIDAWIFDLIKSIL